MNSEIIIAIVLSMLVVIYAVIEIINIASNIKG